MTRAISGLADAVADRSGGRCEAVWAAGGHDPRCPSQAEELHHRIPRARARWRDEHLGDLNGHAEGIAHLCQPCHRRAHAHPDAATAAYLSGPYGATTGASLRHGITVDGILARRLDGTVIYVGRHPGYRADFPDPDRSNP